MRLTPYIRFILPTIFGLYVSCLIAFTHVHIVDGVTIVHSHPYKTTNGVTDDHEHDYASFQLLHQLSTIASGGSILFSVLIGGFTTCFILLFSPVTPVLLREETGNLSPRAPPAGND